MIPGLPGVRFWIWPRHRLEAFGRTVHLTRREGDVMAVLLSDVRRHWLREELVALAYVEPDDEPEFGADTIRTRIWRLRRKFAEHGLRVRIDGRKGSWGGYRLVSITPATPRPIVLPVLPFTAPIAAARASSPRVALAGGRASPGVRPPTIRRTAEC